MTEASASYNAGREDKAASTTYLHIAQCKKSMSASISISGMMSSDKVSL